MTVSPPALPSSSSSPSLTPPGSYQNTAAGQQRPTLTNIHIRSVDDAKKLFYAVQLGMLPKVERRLDAQERRMLRPGNVYVWEEKGPSGGENGYQVCIERWTEGLSWSASRIRDDFLMYYENRKKKSDKDPDGGGGSSSGRARSLENEVLREGERDLYVKQTYSVHRNDVGFEDGLVSGSTSTSTSISNPTSSSNSAEGSSASATAVGGKEGEVKGGGGGGEAGKKEKRKPRKWHLNAYFTKSTEGNLNTIDSIPYLRDLVVPEGIFSSARQTKKSTSSSTAASAAAPKSESLPTSAGTHDVSGEGPSSTGTTTRKRGREGTSVQRTYAPFPVGERGLKPAPPPPPPHPSSVVHHPPGAPVQGMRSQPPAPPPPPQWHPSMALHPQSDNMGGFGAYASSSSSPPAPAPPPPPPSSQSQYGQSLYGTGNGFVVSSPVVSGYEFAGAYGYAGPSQTFGGGMHAHMQSQHLQHQHHPHPQHQHQHNQHQHGQAFRQSPLGGDSPVLSEFGSGGSGGSGASGASTSWHTPSPRPELGLNGGSMSILGSASGGGSGSGSGGGGGGGGGLDGMGGEEDLSGYMPMPPLRYSPDADLDLPPSASASTSDASSLNSLAHTNDDMRMMSLGDSASSPPSTSARYGRAYSHSHSHAHAHSHSTNDLTFVATTINPDFLAGVTTTPNGNGNGNGQPLPPSAALAHETTRRDRSRSTSSNSPFRRRPIQLPQLNVPNTDLSTGGAVEYYDAEFNSASAYAWDSDEYGGGGGGGDGSGNGSGGGGPGGGPGGPHRVALAPLHSLQRNHPYRRNPVDDRQLRMLGPGRGEVL